MERAELSEYVIVKMERMMTFPVDLVSLASHFWQTKEDTEEIGGRSEINESIAE